MTEVIIDAGTLEFSAADEMKATGLLIPYGVPARSNLGTFTFSAGDVTIPDDLTGMSLNSEHKRENVVGGFDAVHEQPEGVVATFAFANTPAGRQAFADAKSGKRKNLSAEVAGVRIQNGKALPGATLFAAAVVEKPAFEGATLLAAEDTKTSETRVTEYIDEDGVTWVRKTTVDRVSEYDPMTGDEKTVEVITTEATHTESEQDDDTEGTTEMNAAAPAVPSTLMASAPAAPTPAEKPIDLGSIFASIATLKSGLQDESAETLLAALSDITYNTTGGLTTAASGVIQPAWVGQLWQGKTYQRRFMDLVTHTVGAIQMGGRKGFKLDQGTALVQKWNGNKAEISSGKGTTKAYGSTIQAYAFAADVAREWWDLEGGAEVIDAFFRGVVDSYAEVTDLDALASIYAIASTGTTALDRLVAPGTYPTQYAGAIGQLIQGIEKVQDDGDDPTFALLNPAAWNQLLYTPKDLIPEFIKFSAATDGTGTADGTVFVRKAPASAFVGLDPAAPATLVGAKRGLEFKELGSTPIQIDALNIAKGGIDKAVIGYVETFPVRAESFALIGTKTA